MRRRLLNLLTALSLLACVSVLFGTSQYSDGGGTFWMGWPIDGRSVVIAFIAVAALPAIRTLHAIVTLPGKLLAVHRAMSGLCTGCGYDLRATPGRCPECGKAATTLA